MPILESTIERSVVNWAKKKGIFVTKINGQGNRAMPDRCFWVPGGTPVLIEFKRPGGKPTPLQTQTHFELRKRGYWVFVCDDAEQAKVLLQLALNSELSVRSAASAGQMAYNYEALKSISRER